MIPSPLVAKVNEVRSSFVDVVRHLSATKSFQTLLASSPSLREEFAAIHKVSMLPRVQQPCDGQVVCAIVGSSGHGKTTILAEMFPQLAQRGWLETDVTETTSQALRIRYSASSAADLEEAEVRSWEPNQLLDLVNEESVGVQNARDGILTAFRQDANCVEVDGTQSTLPANVLSQFKFPRRVELRPFPKPYQLSAAQRAERSFIRSLTTKETSDRIQAGPLLTVDGHGYSSLQLRTIVREVVLRDPFDQVLRWGGLSAEEAAQLVFLDTPGLIVGGSLKDEMLKNILERKPSQILLQLLKHDELDFIVHLVLCGRLTEFGDFWKSVERHCGASALDDLEDRLVLAINGTNIYFSNPDIRKRYLDPAVASRDGDQFAVTIVDNILQRMSPRRPVRPARICFLDSARILPNYQDFYAQQRATLHSWGQPGGVGQETLARLGLQEVFPQNVEALCDPDDRGQGFLVRQLVALIRERGPALFVRKHLIRTGLHPALGNLRNLLERYYDAEGRLNRQAILEAVRSCLRFLDPANLASIESFARTRIDPLIDALKLGLDGRTVQSKNWVEQGFLDMCRVLYQGIVQQVRVSTEVAGAFARYMTERVRVWRKQLGYHAANFAPPLPQDNAVTDLVRHGLKIHCREILYQLLSADLAPGSEQQLSQDPADQEQVRRLRVLLGQIEQQSEAVCKHYQVK